MEIGNTLKAARESRGVTLEAAEESTKIRRKYLEALEGENFGQLPGRVYIKGFLRNYAKFLGLNADALVSAYEEMVPLSEVEDDSPSAKRITTVERPGGRKFFRIVLGLIVIGLVAALVYLPPRAGKNDITPPGSTENRVAEEKNKTAPGEKAAPGPAQGLPIKQRGVNVTLNVTDNQSWMHVEVDGKPVFTGLVPAGQVKEFKGNEKISLRLGNAGVVQVEFNGQKMGALGGFGQVVTKEFMAPQV